MKVEGSNITINDSVVNRLTIIPEGACEQDSYSGKNKFGTSLTYSSSYLTIVNPETNNFSYKMAWNGTLADASNTSKMLKANTNYTISFRFRVLSRPDSFSTSNHNRFFILFRQSPAVNQIIAYDDRKNTGTLNTWYEYSNTFTTPEDMSNVRIGMYDYKDGNNVNAGEIEIDNLQIEEGSTATSFEKYVGGIPSPNPDYPQDIRNVTGENSVVVQNKNLLDVSSINETLYGVDFDGRDGTLKVNGSYSGPTYLRIGTAYLKANTIYTSNIVLKSGTAKSGETDVSIDLVTYYNNNYKRFNGINEIPADGIYNLYIANGYSSNTVFTNAVYEIQLEKGNSSTSFVKHAEQTATLNLGTEYLASIPNTDYRDKIVGTKDNWKIVRNVGKVVLDGTNNPVYGYSNHSGTTYITANYKKTGIIIPTDNTTSCISNKLLGTIIANTWNGNILNSCALGTNDTYIQICLPYAIASDLTELNTWLTSNNIDIYYKATPTEETITDTTLIEQLNNLQDMLSYDGITNITVTSDTENNAQMIVEVEYTSESEACERLLYIFNKMKDKLYHIIRSL